MALGECYQDHVLVSSRIASAVSEVSTLDCVSNFSDHRPILAICQLHLAELITHIDRPTKRKISIVWNKASNEDLQRYSELVNHRLQDISLPDDIVHYTEPFRHNHQHDLDNHCKAICDCLVQSANVCIPDNLHHKRVAGWNESACFFFVQKFGYKKGFSTDLCTGLLKLVSSRYIHHGSKVRCALLDMSKAFDMVDHGQLFETLCQRNLPNPVYSIFAAVVQQPACGNQVEWYSIFTFSSDKRSPTCREGSYPQYCLHR